MRKIAFLFLTLFFLLSIPVFAGESAEEQEEIDSADQIAALEARIDELERQLQIGRLELVVDQLESLSQNQVISISVQPIDGSERIPEVGEFFREVIVSALAEYGIRATESLDDEILDLVRHQDQLVNESLINRVTASPRGELHGVSHYLLGTVTRYNEEDTDKIYAFGGILEITLAGGARIRSGSLVVDFRLIDARTGIVTEDVAFQTAATVKQIQGGGAIIGGLFGGGSYSEKPLPERAARDCARQAARQIAVLLGIELPEEEEFLTEENMNPYRD